MVGSLWTGISGLSGAQTALDNESNNIANVNTVGYKASRISFADQMYQDNIGKGVSSYEVEKLYTQGNLKVTGVNYDMALSGDGFFLVNDGAEDYFTRAGNFRMGENGTLQTAGALAVQGWAMKSVQPEDVRGTDSNATKFTNDYTKLLGNQIIRGSTDILTITTKATDYTETARSDDQTTFTGASQKTASTKISDVELLVTEYNRQLSIYANANPKPTATDSKVQREHLDFNLDFTTPVLAEGDEMYIIVDGVKYSQSYDTSEATTTKLLIDRISNIPGFSAYMTNGDANADGTWDAGEYELNTQDTKGELMIESIIPGKQIRVSEIGWIDASSANAVTKGTITTMQEAVEGSGLGAIRSAQEAMSEAVSGKQQDVYSSTDLFALADGLVDGDHDFTYSISIYDKTLEKNIMIPNDGSDNETATPLDLSGLVSDDDDPIDAIDALVDAINTNAVGDTNELADYIKAYNINGTLVIKTLDDNFDVEFTSDLKLTAPAATAGDIARNANISGVDGAGAECLSINTSINQTSTKSDIQLRLDSLALTDSAFGDFSVDASGLITMKQDGADFAIGQVAIARFTDNRGMSPEGDNLLKATNRSGQAIYNLDNDKTAEIRGGTLELSTSDLSESLVNLMVFQRAFEANSKSISTADQILTTLIQLKR